MREREGVRCGREGGVWGREGWREGEGGREGEYLLLRIFSPPGAMVDEDRERVRLDFRGYLSLPLVDEGWSTHH